MNFLSKRRRFGHKIRRFGKEDSSEIRICRIFPKLEERDLVQRSEDSGFRFIEDSDIRNKIKNLRVFKVCLSTRQTVEPTPFAHLMNNVLTSAMYATAFEAWGVTLVTDLLSLIKEDIELDFPGTDGATTRLRLMNKKRFLKSKIGSMM